MVRPPSQLRGCYALARGQVTRGAIFAPCTEAKQTGPLSASRRGGGWLQRVFEAAIPSVETGIPALANASDQVREGCLLSYSPDWENMAGRTAYYVDRILRGAAPGDLLGIGNV